MNKTVYTFNPPAKEIVKEYYEDEVSPAEEMQKFLNDNPNYRVKDMRIAKREYPMYVLVVYELEEENE